MTRFTVEARSEALTVSLDCEAGEGRLIILGEGSGLPGFVVQAFRPAMDIFYRSPELLTPEELAEEVAIHVPQSLREIPQGRLVPSALDGLVLMQYVHPAFPAISPLASLGEILGATADVNFGILQADNGGLLFLHRAGAEIHAYASTYSLKELLELRKDERESLLPSIHADEVLVSGTDLDHFENLDFGPIEIARKISFADFLPLCEFTPESTSLIEPNPHLYTLAIGAARAYAAIGGWVA
ncbi:MAG TPA: hypothetical protein VFH95_15240 [Candidatus Kapabacteria bacterium]|nr:hypothetical protein [Candidatus Kapabacteria bacterium]